MEEAKKEEVVVIKSGRPFALLIPISEGPQSQAFFQSKGSTFFQSSPKHY